MTMNLSQEKSISRPGAFTLLEVMIAMGIFFVTVFSILDLVAANLRYARRLQQVRVDCGLVIADLYQTNKLEEGTDEGDFGDLYPGYHWQQFIEHDDADGTNGFFRVQYILIHPDNTAETNLSALMWKPDSPAAKP